MSVERVSPATIFDMAALAGASTRQQWWIAREMHAGGITWAFRKNGETFAVLGIYPDEDGNGEAWFNVKPEAARDMLSVCRAGRLTLPETPYREVYTYCTSNAGKRIAAMMGFVFSAEHELGEKWIWTYLQADQLRPQKDNKRKASAKA